MKVIKKHIASIIILIILVILIPLILFIKKKRSLIILGTVPMIQYKYWSNALNKIGYNSITLVNKIYHIHDRQDFDITSIELIPRFLKINKKFTNSLLEPIFTFFYILKNASSFNSSFVFGAFSNLAFYITKIEFFIYHFFRIKVIISGFGGDFYMYSKVIDKSLTHGLLSSYPLQAKNELQISKRVGFFMKYADFIMMGFQLDGIGRWDVLLPNFITIDNTIINKSQKIKSEKTTIAHTPNHRGFKGTEFIINVVDELKSEGYNVELILIEGKKNYEVLEILNKKADILIEQLLFPGYALSAIEGMANGIPVLSNLDNDTYMNLFRRFSYLDECPILSTTPESLKSNLIKLIEDNKLRDKLGELGVDFVKKYHSEEFAQYLYKNIFQKLEKNLDNELINIFHPLKSEYVKQNFIKTPLVNNQFKG